MSTPSRNVLVCLVLLAGSGAGVSLRHLFRTNAVEAAEPGHPIAEEVSEQQLDEGRRALSSVLAANGLESTESAERPDSITNQGDKSAVSWSGDTRTVYYGSGTVHSEGRWVNGQREGLHRAWHETGVLWSEAEWEAGAREGLATNFDRAGNLSSRGAYKSGFRDGRWTTYYSKTGLVQSEGRYERRQKTGRWRTWLWDGSLESDGHYVDGDREGYWVFWTFGRVNEDRTGFYESGRKTGAE